jgi:hypothetical protein
VTALVPPAPRQVPAVLLALACVAAPAAEPEPEIQRVLVEAAHASLEEKPYRHLLEAMRMYEPYGRAHPDARLRFRVRQRKAEGDMAHLRLFILDIETGERVPLEVDADGRFTVPVIESMSRRNAVVRSNMPAGSLAWMVDVRRAGDDPRDLVLGDLREECRLDVGAAGLVRAYKTPAFYALQATTDVCTDRAVYWGAFSDKPLFAVHLRHGAREASLPLAALYGSTNPVGLDGLFDFAYLLRDCFFRVPWDAVTWPDDTRVHITYAEDPALAAALDP